MEIDEEAYPYLSGKVEDVMTKDPLVVLEDEPLRRLIDVFAKARFHGMPVVNSDYKLVGVVRDTDVMSMFARKNPAAMKLRTVKDVMHVPPLIIHPDETAQTAVVKMFTYGSRILVVVDKKKNILGVVTRIDLIRSIKFRAEE